jgi:hypothetical protein
VSEIFLRNPVSETPTRGRRGNKKPGFCDNPCILVRDFALLTRFLNPRARRGNKKPGFCDNPCILVRDFPKKPGF